ncbi:gamma-glutamylcyclotransferase [Blastococcus saxobsidens]|uniref:AIG2-like family protein n=1 Tax=Blastococcus saxobsidens (strain DD2) TaxID=1146883 RepID=H6RL24_BLASD|nr:gamma-glutamylcyclotransferase [Blastococcus saxobsidens]CCG04991.1 AIG2-like family protein [Blastococcus saxobsidens DD2]
MGLYAAYGSNMDPAQMLRRCPSSPHTGTGWIRGWRLTFGGEELGWEGALATLVPADDDSPGVFVALYDLTGADERALDAWEGADSGLYRRVHLRVHITAPQGGRSRATALLGGDVVAYVYALDAFEGGLPSARHLGAIADGAEAAGAPDDYVRELRSRECRSAGL